MKPPVPIAIDLDGVLVDWVKGYRALVKTRLGVDLPEAHSWEWDKEFLTESQLYNIWKYLKTTPRWWGDLEPLPGTEEFLQWANIAYLYYDIYFVTQRPRSVKLAAEGWLESWGYDHPQVIVSQFKADVYAGIGIQAAVDDSVAVATSCRDRAHTDMTIIDAPYNQTWNGKRVTGIMDWWKWLEEQTW